MALTKVSGDVIQSTINVGVVTASSFIGNLTGNATGLSGTPNITVGSITASSATITGNVSVAGTVTYEDTTNVDSIGVITARSGIHVTDGSVGIGTTLPITSLTIRGSSPASGELGRLAVTGNTTAKRLAIGVDSDAATMYSWMQSVESGVNFRNLILQPLGGNIGIGTTNPDQLLTLQSGGDSQISFKNTSGVSKAYVGTSGAFGSASTDDLRIRSDSSNIIFGFNGSESARITSGNFVGIGITNPSAVLHAREQNTTAPSLTWGASCGQIFRNENSEFALGLSNQSPYPLWIQGRTLSSTRRDIVVNPLGGNFGVGVVPWTETTDGLNFKTLVANYQANGSMTTSSWADTTITLTAASNFVFAKIIAVGHENGRNNGFREYFVSWNVYAGWSTNLLVTSNQGNDYGLVDVRMNGSTVQVKAVNNASSGQYRLYVTHYLT